MDDRKKTNNIDLPRSNLLEALRTTTRSSTWGKYLQILQMASRPGGVTMNDISMEMALKPQSVHPLLKKLINQNILIREQRSQGRKKAEFYYYLAPNISAQEIGANSEDLSELTNSYENQTKNSETLTSDSSKPLSSVIDQKNLPKPSLEWQEKKLQLKLSKLPEFNPEWDLETQKSWFAALERISSTTDLNL